MTKIFYDHLIKVGEIICELDKYNLTIEEKDEFIELVDGTFHHYTLKVILDNLPAEHHQDFLSMFHLAPDDKNLLDFLKKHSKIDIEKEISNIADKLKKEIMLDIQKSKKK